MAGITPHDYGDAGLRLCPRANDSINRLCQDVNRWNADVIKCVNICI